MDKEPMVPLKKNEVEVFSLTGGLQPEEIQNYLRCGYKIIDEVKHDGILERVILKVPNVRRNNK
jgi:hypothetical protein